MLLFLLLLTFVIPVSATGWCDAWLVLCLVQVVKAGAVASLRKKSASI